MRVIFSLFFLITFLFSAENNLDNLLSQYREEEELYLETKDAKAGHVIVFSRADLDRMQAYTLNDVLKTLRLFTLKATKLGMASPVKSSFAESATSSIRIFVNSYELHSITMGTALAQFGKMGLNFIDHIEVYQASNSITFGGEPSNMTIKLYTKDPSRENATVVQASIDSKAGTRAQAIEAKSFEDYSYLANVDISKDNYDEYKASSNEYSKDGYRGQANFNFSKKDDFKVEFGANSEKYDLFGGLGYSIIDGDMNTKKYYIQFTKYFDNDFKLTLSNSFEQLKVNNSDFLGISLFDSSLSNNIFFKNETYINTASLEKKYFYGNNSLVVDLEAKFKEFSLEEFQSNGADKNMAIGPKNLDIYMASLENTYSFNDDNFIVIGAKVDYYNNHATESSTENIFRLSYVGQFSRDFGFKFFTQKSYNYPVLTQTTFSPIYKPNPDLKSSTYVMTKAEVEYKREKLTVTLGGGISESENGIVFNQSQKMFVNSPNTSDFKQLHINTNYKFDSNNKLIVEYFKAYNDKFTYSSDDGALIQLFNKAGKFDIYNELIYRSSYTGIDGVKIDTGYDYTAGIIYNYNKKLALKLKGENLFDMASETNIDSAKVPAIERRAIFTMEYIF